MRVNDFSKLIDQNIEILRQVLFTFPFYSSRMSGDTVSNKSAPSNLSAGKTNSSKVFVPVTSPVNGVSTGRNTNLEPNDDHCNVVKVSFFFFFLHHMIFFLFCFLNAVGTISRLFYLMEINVRCVSSLVIDVATVHAYNVFFLYTYVINLSKTIDNI